MEGKTGYLVPVGDAHAMAERILCLLADEVLRITMGNAAAEDAAEKFGLERMIGDYLSFYQDILRSNE